MSEQRAVIRNLLPELYLIDDAGHSTCYLLCGQQRAMLIDTLNGMENLRDIVRSITPLPLLVVNTHGHCDHVFGNIYFEKAYMHPADQPVAEAFFEEGRTLFASQGLSPCPFQWLQVGQHFDLGGWTLEVVSLRGHTPGSIGLLDRKNRLLFSGDGLNPHLWMQLEHSTSIHTLRETLLALNAKYRPAFDYILGGHDTGFRDAVIIDELLRGCNDMLVGRLEQDAPFHYFGGDCLQHPLHGKEAQCIVYTCDKLS